MSRVLAISSWVARGHVGLSAIVPILQRCGHDTIGLPTVVLSNHLGHAHFAGSAVPAEQLAAMLEALYANGWLSEVDVVLTGYLPTAAHVAFAQTAIQVVLEQNPATHIVCDPVIGDAPTGLYVPEDVAFAMRADLLPIAHRITPNGFELGWLAGRPVRDLAEAVAAARSLAVAQVVATSIPAGEGQLATLAVDANTASVVVGPQLAGVPHGTGDVLDALLVAAQLAGRDLAGSLGYAAGALGALISASLGSEELQIVAAQELWSSAAPADIQNV